ncbi:MAG: ArsB/NhaD family transporter [Alphaproteobacteria bacterium]|nr:ArsB/NhaD family transporter [Alphaproteobacteria bacterium]
MHGSAGPFEPHIWFGLDPLWVSTAILVVVYATIMSEKLNRAIAALVGAGVVLLVGALDFPEAVKGIDWNTIALLTGMMILVAVTRKCGVFQYVAIVSAQWSKGNPAMIMILLSTVTAVFSALLDNVTTVLLVAPVTLALCKELEVPPYPFLFAEIFASNIGGTATLIGDPPNILIGSLVGLSFNDFVYNLTPVVVVVMAVQLAMTHLLWGRSMAASDAAKARIMAMKAHSAIVDPRLMKKSLWVLGVVILGFVAQRQLHQEPGAIAMLGAAVLMMLDALGHPPETQSEKTVHAFNEVEWITIFFFVGLFVVIRGVEVAGLLKILADAMLTATGGDLALTALAILWASAILSAIIDNIPFVATMIPLIKEMAPAFGGPEGLMPLWWSLSLGACLGGNGSLIGASANLTVAGIAERNGVPFRFLTFLKYAFPMMLVSIAISHVYVWWRYL